VLLSAFVFRQRTTRNPLLPLVVVSDRNRGGALTAVLLSSAGVFGILLFASFLLEKSLGYSPIQTGIAFLPMIGVLVVTAQVSTNLLLPRLGPRILIPSGLVLAAVGALMVSRLSPNNSDYVVDILPGFLILGVGLGLSMPASVQTATLGVNGDYAGVGSALVNTSQQIGGSVGTALLSTVATATSATYLASHSTATATSGECAAIDGDTSAFAWSSAVFATGAIIAGITIRSRTMHPLH